MKKYLIDKVPCVSKYLRILHKNITYLINLLFSLQIISFPIS